MFAWRCHVQGGEVRGDRVRKDAKTESGCAGWTVREATGRSASVGHIPRPLVTLHQPAHCSCLDLWLVRPPPPPPPLSPTVFSLDPQPSSAAHPRCSGPQTADRAAPMWIFRGRHPRPSRAIHHVAICSGVRSHLGSGSGRAHQCQAARGDPTPRLAVLIDHVPELGTVIFSACSRAEHVVNYCSNIGIITQSY